MNRYFLYFLDKGVLLDSDEFLAEDDAEASRIARGRNGERTVELWSEDRRLEVIAPTRTAALLMPGPCSPLPERSAEPAAAAAALKTYPG
jgi:hypothetical protein